MRDWHRYYATRAPLADASDASAMRQVGKTVGGTPVDEVHLARIVEAIVGALALDANDHCLDLGCGNGLVTVRVAPFVARLVGVDVSPVLIADAERLRAAANLRYACGDLVDASALAPQSRKLYAYEVWQHVEPEAARRALGAWRDHLRVYAHEAPHYDQTLALVDAVLGTAPRTLTELDVAGLRAVAARLGIGTQIRVLSELGLALPSRAAPGEWALLIACAIGADAYRNPVGGKALFDPAQYAAAGIELSFHEPTTVRYATGSFPFVPDLSVLDVLMWATEAELASFMAANAGDR